MTDHKRNQRFRKERSRVIKLGTQIQRDTFSEIDQLLKVAGQQISQTLAGAPTDYQAWQLPQLQQAIANAANELQSGGAGAYLDGVSKSWEAGTQLVETPIAAGGIRIAAVLPEIDVRQLQAMRVFLTSKIADISSTMVTQINSELGLVMIGAKSPGEAISAVQSILKVSRSRAITITRTELGRAFSTAAQQRLKQARKHLTGLKKQWRRSGKTHSRVAHDSIDGQVRDVDKKFTLGNGKELMYPRDPAASASETINCGCESLPYMESWDVVNPGRVPFTDDELARSATKRALAQSAA